MADRDREDAPIRRQVRGIVLILLATVAITGCGTPGAPQPPTLNLPQPITDLTAERTADTVRLTWTMSAQTTDKLPVKGAITAHICRRDGDGPCERVASEPVAVAADASFIDTLPSGLLGQSPRLLTYRVEVANRSGRSAGSSNDAYVASGPGVPALTGFRAEVRADGVLLRWTPVQPAGAVGAIRIARERIEQPLPPSLAFSRHNESRQEPAEQTLEVKLKTGAGGTAAAPGPTRAPGVALDRQASFGERYRYRAQREVEITVDGHTLPEVGAWSDPVIVDVRDTFPPAVPVGLLSAPDTEGHAIDLSWTPDTDADLAGYVVYRRDVTASGRAERISNPKAPVPTPSFRDTTAEPGKQYAYTVSAVDRSGNESQPSAETMDILPQQ